MIKLSEMKKVWLLKSESPNQSYEELLLENEFVVKSIPTLEFEYQCKEEIETALNSPDEFGGIVFTSIRGVQSVSDIFVSLSDSVKEQWKSKLVFVVGQATEKSVKENLKLDSIGSEGRKCKATWGGHYTPSGVDFALPIFNELQLDINTVRIIALGPSTNAALHSNKIDVYGVCREPTPKGLLDTLSLESTMFHT
ncbi:Uroporphyrinogen-III synthase [Armadillidium nasatum]|uniref:Uroporphyrinogen-III synthase n=1 Tax=Armadillidium nasatum TaxID=96803 RepID=A0A5N5SPN8_9CRUS|nr:Uroporphyrinogen-III synthase [Armadillidium nasatum]